MIYGTAIKKLWITLWSQGLSSRAHFYRVSISVFKSYTSILNITFFFQQVNKIPLEQIINSFLLGWLLFQASVISFKVVFWPLWWGILSSNPPRSGSRPQTSVRLCSSAQCGLQKRSPSFGIKSSPSFGIRVPQALSPLPRLLHIPGLQGDAHSGVWWFQSLQEKIPHLGMDGITVEVLHNKKLLPLSADTCFMLLQLSELPCNLIYFLIQVSVEKGITR